MPNYEERLYDEDRDLVVRLERLKAFILSDKYESLPEVDRRDLKEQLTHMEAYFKVLRRRLSRLCNRA